MPVATKFAVSYIRVSTKSQTKEDKSGIKRQEHDYLNWLERNPDYKNLEGLETKKVREEQSLMEENYKKHSQEICRDIRFPKAS